VTKYRVLSEQNYENQTKQIGATAPVKTSNTKYKILNPDKPERLLSETVKPVYANPHLNVLDNPDFKEKSKYQKARFGSLYYYLNDDGKSAKAARESGTAFTQETREIEGVMNLNPTELAIYNYYINTGDKKTAKEYLYSLKEQLAQRKAQKIVENIESKKGAEKAVMKGVNAVLTGTQRFQKGMEQVGRRITGNKEPITHGALETASDEIYKYDTGASKVTYDILQSIGNMIPSMIVGGGAGSIAGAATMGVQVAGGSYRTSREEGYSDAQSMLYGVTNGALEGALQYVLGGIGSLGKGGVSKLVSKIPALKPVLSKADGLLKSAIKSEPVRNALRIGGQYIANMGDEALEEYLQAVIDPVVRNAIFDENNEINPLSDEALYSAFVGALTAGVLNIPSVVSGDTVATNTDIQQPAAQQPIVSDTALQGVTGQANSMVQPEVQAYRIGGEAVMPMSQTQYTQTAPNIQADTDVKAARDFSQDADSWTATNQNVDLQGNVRSLGDIVKVIETEFGIPISTGKITQHDAAGIYKVRPEAVRTQVANALPVIAHEVGHHIDKQSGVSRLPEINEAIGVFQTNKPDIAQKYQPSELKGEAVAEFVREYMSDKTATAQKYPTFYNAFRSAVNPETLSKLDRVSNMVNAYMTADSLTQLKSAITNRGVAQRERGLKEKLLDLKNKANLAFIDSAAPLQKISESAYEAYMQSLNSDGQIRYMIEEGMTNINADLVSDTGLTQVLADIPSDKMRDFEAYLVAKHAAEWIDSGKRVFANDKLNNSNKMRETVSKFETQNPNFETVANNLYDWQRQMMKIWLVDTGVITQELYNKLWTMYPNYVPFFRNTDKGFTQSKSASGKQSTPIKSAKGSGLDLYSPVENILINIDRFVKTANRNAVMQEIANAANTVDGIGNIIEAVPPSRVPKSVSTESARSELETALAQATLSDADVDTVMQTFDDVLGKELTEWNMKQLQDGDITWAYIDGQRQFFQVHDADVLKSLTSLGGKKSNEVIRFIAAVSRTFKTLVTGSNPFFTVGSNVWRDLTTALIQGGEANPFKLTRDIVSAYMDIVKNTDSYKSYKASGSTYATVISHPKEISSFMNSIYNADRPGLKRFFSSFVSVLEGIEHFSDVVETAPRLAEFNRVLKQTGDARKAAYAAAEVTVNFKRSGTAGRQVDAIYPYFNAQAQAVAKQARMIKKNPVNFLGRMLAGTAIISAIQMFILHALGGEDEYEKLSSYIKNNYYNFYVGNGKFIRIPKAQSLAVASSALERAYEMAILDNPDAFYDFSGYLTNQFIPPGVPNFNDGFKPIATDIVGVGTISEIMANEDFKGTPIVPTQYQKLDKWQQYNDKTSWIAKQVGRSLNWSPMEIDHFINSNFGVLGKLNRALTSEDRDLSMGLSTQFISDSAYSTDVLNRFYEQFDDSEVMKNSYPEKGKYIADYKQRNSAKSIISAINQLGRNGENDEREYKILSRDYALDFIRNPPDIDDRLVSLYERTGDVSIFYDKEFSNTFTIDGETKTLGIEQFIDYAKYYNDTASSVYDDVLKSGLPDDLLIKALNKVKSDIGESAKQKAFDGEVVGVVKAVELGIPASDYLQVKITASTDGNSSISQDEARAALDKTNLTREQKSVMWNLINSGWKTNPYGGVRSSENTPISHWGNVWGGILNGN
jgi:hypothetical protein